MAYWAPGEGKGACRWAGERVGDSATEFSLRGAAGAGNGTGAEDEEGDDAEVEGGDVPPPDPPP